MFSGIHKEEKQKIKQLLLHFLPDFMFLERGELSDDEDEDDEGRRRKNISNLYFNSRKYNKSWGGCMEFCNGEQFP